MPNGELRIAKDRMIGNVKSPLPSFYAGFARTADSSQTPHLRRLMGVTSRGLVATCNPCLGIQSSDLFNLGRQKKGNYNVTTRNWVQSPVGPAIVINEGTDSILWATADNNDFQFQDAYGIYELSSTFALFASLSGGGECVQQHGPGRGG